MLLNMDTLTDWDIMKNDATYEAFLDKARDLHKQIEELRFKLGPLLNNIHMLEVTRDAVMSKAFDFECTSKQVDSTLLKYTGECSECWYGTYSSGADLIRDHQVLICQDVLRLKLDIDALQDKLSTLNKERDVYGKQLVKSARGLEAKK